jgi:hypothetical protein
MEHFERPVREVVARRSARDSRARPWRARWPKARGDSSEAQFEPADRRHPHRVFF